MNRGALMLEVTTAAAIQSSARRGCGSGVRNENFGILNVELVLFWLAYFGADWFWNIYTFPKVFAFEDGQWWGGEENGDGGQGSWLSRECLGPNERVAP